MMINFFMCKMNIFYFAIFGLLWTVVADELTPCTTPNGETASCVPLLRCVALIRAAASDEPVAVRFFNESVCNEKISTVCCGTSGNFTNSLTTPKPLSEKEIFDDLSKEGKRDYVLKELLPTQTICGFQHTDDYFYNGTETSVDEFPWLVYVIERNIEHDSQYYLRMEINCAGALISKRYVLSTKVCRSYAQFYAATDIIDMILGLHHIHKTVNCIGTQFGVDDCTDPSLRVSSSHWTIYGEVVLFRLDNKIDYSEFIRPICLPLQEDEIPTAGSLVMASGWSEEKFVTGKSLKLKKRMKYIVMSKKECESNNPLKNPICGIPLESNAHYICNGDIGGPLMYRHMQRNWFAVGLIFQTAIRLCDAAQPVTSQRLTPEIVTWIIENIEP